MMQQYNVKYFFTLYIAHYILTISVMVRGNGRCFMARSVLVLGVSGTGKSHSIQNLSEKTTFLVNVFGKALPFKGWRKKYVPIRSFRDAVGNTAVADDVDTIVTSLKYAYARGFRTIVIDDYQFVAGMKTIRDAKIKGYDKFTDIAQGFVKVADICREMPDDAIVMFLSHIEDDGSGGTKAKTAGRMVDNVIGFESLFTIVLQTFVKDGRYGFETQNNGKNTVKSPEGMFPLEIDNDLEFVRKSIIAYDEGEDMPVFEKTTLAEESKVEQKTGFFVPESSFSDVDQPFGANVEHEDFSPESTAVEDDVDEFSQAGKRALDVESFDYFYQTIAQNKPALVSLLKAGFIRFNGHSVIVEYENRLSGQYNSVSTEQAIQTIEQLLANFYGYTVQFIPTLQARPATNEGTPDVFHKHPTNSEKAKGFDQMLTELVDTLGGKAEATAFLVRKRSLKDGQPIDSLSLVALQRLHGNLDKLVEVKAKETVNG